MLLHIISSYWGLFWATILHIKFGTMIFCIWLLFSYSASTLWETLCFFFSHFITTWFGLLHVLICIITMSNWHPSFGTCVCIPFLGHQSEQYFQKISYFFIQLFSNSKDRKPKSLECHPLSIMSVPPTPGPTSLTSPFNYIP